MRDYLSVLQRQRLLIVLVLLGCIGASIVLSLTSAKVYESTASVRLNDVSQDVQLLGRSIWPQNPADASATASARVDSLEVAQLAVKYLGDGTDPEVLRDQVSSEVELRTNYVDVTAEDGSAQRAAAIAGATSRALVRLVTRDKRDQFKRVAASLRTQLRGVLKSQRRNHVDRFTQASTRTSYQSAILQLDSLARIADPAVVVSPSEVPSSPSAPKPVRNGIIGFLVGLILGLLLAFLRDSLDRRLRGVHDVRSETGLPLIGHVSGAGMGTVGFGRNGHRKMPAEDVEATRILRTNLGYLDVDHPPKVIAVTSALPEEGKSTVSASIATASALAGQRTLLIETDLRRPALSSRFGIEREPGLSDYLVGDSQPADILQIVPLTDTPGDESAPTLVCIAAGRAVPRPAELLQSKRMTALLEQVRDVYDTVVIDTAPLLPVVDTLSLLPQVDAIALCVRSRQTTRDQARALMAALSHVPKRPTGVVITGVKAGDEETYAYYSYAYA